MNNISPPRLILVALVCTTLGCISTQKHYESLELLKANHQSELDDCQSQITVATAINERLSYQVSEEQSAVNDLLNLRSELYDTIAQLRINLVEMGNKTASNQQNNNTELFQKQNSVKRLNVQLQEVDALINRYSESVKTLAFQLQEAFQNISEEDIQITNSDDQVRIVISESFLFLKKSTTRLEKRGTNALRELSKIIAEYPQLQIDVIGHTDNTPPHRSFKDNWIFSVLQAATIVRKLTNDFDLNQKQITASGKGEFAPRASNDTSKGRDANRRIELLLAPNYEDFVNTIRNQLKS